MSADSPCSEAMRRTLADRTVGTPDASAVAEAVFTTWRSVAERLDPVIGGKGVDVLFRRALHLTSQSFPWLAIVEDYEDSATFLANLKMRFETCDAAVATAMGNALLVTFTDLLTGLLGDPLTERLLGPVLLPSKPESQQESSP